MAKIPTLKPRLATHAFAPRLQSSAADAGRVEARGTTAERGYGGWWQRESKAFREHYTGCVYCWLDGRSGPVELVDHLYPHGLRRDAQSRSQKALFRLKTYWLPSCHDCHRSFKAQIEAEGIEAIDALAIRLGLDPLADDELRRACLRALTRNK